MNSAIGNFDSSGARIAREQTPESGYVREETLTSEILVDNKLKRQLIEQQVTINNLEVQIAQLQTKIETLAPRTLSLEIPPSFLDLSGFETATLQGVVGLICALRANGMDWDLIQARIMGIE